MVTGNSKVGCFGCMQICRGVLADVLQQIIAVTQDGEDFVKVIIKRLFWNVEGTKSCSFSVFFNVAPIAPDSLFGLIWKYIVADLVGTDGLVAMEHLWGEESFHARLPKVRVIRLCNAGAFFERAGLPGPVAASG